MKKTFPVNINGTIFYIDEDAYNLLSTYLNQLRQAFPGDEGKEIVSDIEARIAELFGEYLSQGANVININNVNEVIEKMGRPSDLSDEPEEHREEESDENSRREGQPTPPPFQGVSKKLYRNMQNKVFGGVLSGTACYFGWNTNILRLLVVILALFTYFWPMVLIYLIAWMVIPAAVTPRQILEMKGAPVTIGNLGQTIIGTADGSASDQGAGILPALGKIILMFFGGVAAIAALVCLIILIKLICGTIVFYGWNDFSLLDGFDIACRNPTFGAIGGICLALCITIPCIALVWATCSVVFKVKGISKPILIGGIIIEVLLIIAATVLLSIANIPAIGSGMALASMNC